MKRGSLKSEADGKLYRSGRQMHFKTMSASRPDSTRRKGSKESLLCPSPWYETLTREQLIELVIEMRFMLGHPVSVTRSEQLYQESVKLLAGKWDEEHLWIVVLDSGLRIRDTIECTQLSPNTCHVHLSGLFKKVFAIKKCHAIAMVHNHPSGTLQPSTEDDKLTGNVQKTCKMLGLQFLDHVIATEAGYYSYADQGRLTFLP